MIKDKNIDTGAKITYHSVNLSYQPALTNGVANTTIQDAWIAPFAGKIVAATSFCTAVTATGTLDLFKASSSILSGAVTPVANTATDIFSSVSTATFAAGDVISLRTVTTGGSGALTGSQIRLTVRPLVAAETFGY